MAKSLLFLLATLPLCSCGAPNSASQTNATALDTAPADEPPPTRIAADPAKRVTRAMAPAKEKDRAMTDIPSAKPSAPAKPVTPPLPTVKRSPTEIPAEVDPVHPEPGDEVPR